MKRTTLLSAIALPALIFLFSCNNGGTSSGTPGSGDSTTGGVSDPNRYHGGGHAVPWSYIQPCIDAYIDTMNRYGINADSPRQKITKCPDSTYFTTNSEVFRADSLMAYLKAQIDKYDPKGKGANLNFVIYPGIRTVNLLTDYGYGLGTSTAGRITYFIVPDTSSTPPQLRFKKGMKAIPADGGGGSGFEVGSIQP